MAASCESLAPELLTQILTFVRSASRVGHTNDFSNSLRVCSKWHDLGQKLLWTDISLRDSKIGLIDATNSPRHASTLSLTVLVHPPMYRWSDEEIATHSKATVPGTIMPATLRLWDALGVLPRHITSMVNLKCFSFKVCDYNQWKEPQGFCIERKYLLAILRALPSGLENLEIDTYGLDRSTTTSSPLEYHLCPSIKSYLSKLQNLRLRVSRLCTDILDASPCKSPEHPSSLRGIRPSITINAINLLHSSIVLPCTEPVSRRIKTRLPTDSSKFLKKLFETLAGSYSGAVSCLENAGMDQAYGKKDMYPTIAKRSTNPSRLQSYPYGNTYDCNYFLRIQDAQGNDCEIRGPFDALTNEVEDNKWKETEAGCRFPVSHIAQEPRLRCAQLVSPVVTFSAPPTEYTGLGKAEMRTGRILLRMAESDCLVNVGGIKRGKTELEIRREQSKNAHNSQHV